MVTRCRAVFGIASVLGILSIGVGNVLVLLRVVVLWDGNPVGILILIT